MCGCAQFVSQIGLSGIIKGIHRRKYLVLQRHVAHKFRFFFFESLPDPRVQRRRRHKLTDVVLMVLVGLIGGIRGPPSRPTCHRVDSPRHPLQGCVFTMSDPGVHDAAIRAFTTPIPVFTMPRSTCSR